MPESEYFDAVFSAFLRGKRLLPILSSAYFELAWAALEDVDCAGRRA